MIVELSYMIGKLNYTVQYAMQKLYLKRIVTMSLIKNCPVELY